VMPRVSRAARKEKKCSTIQWKLPVKKGKIETERKLWGGEGHFR
jgi:hypothetical protein